MFGKCGVFPCSSSLNKNIASWAHPACTSGFPEHLDDKADRNCLRSQRNPWILEMGRLVSFSDYTSIKFISKYSSFMFAKMHNIVKLELTSHEANHVTYICSSYILTSNECIGWLGPCVPVCFVGPVTSHVFSIHCHLFRHDKMRPPRSPMETKEPITPAGSETEFKEWMYPLVI